MVFQLTITQDVQLEHGINEFKNSRLTSFDEHVLSLLVELFPEYQDMFNNSKGNGIFGAKGGRAKKLKLLREEINEAKGYYSTIGEPYSALDCIHDLISHVLVIDDASGRVHIRRDRDSGNRFGFGKKNASITTSTLAEDVVMYMTRTGTRENELWWSGGNVTHNRKNKLGRLIQALDSLFENGFNSDISNMVEESAGFSKQKIAFLKHEYPLQYRALLERVVEELRRTTLRDSRDESQIHDKIQRTELHIRTRHGGIVLPPVTALMGALMEGACDHSVHNAQIAYDQQCLEQARDDRGALDVGSVQYQEAHTRVKLFKARIKLLRAQEDFFKFEKDQETVKKLKYAQSSHAKAKALHELHILELKHKNLCLVPFENEYIAGLIRENETLLQNARERYKVAAEKHEEFKIERSQLKTYQKTHETGMKLFLARKKVVKAERHYLEAVEAYGYEFDTCKGHTSGASIFAMNKAGRTLDIAKAYEYKITAEYAVLKSGGASWAIEHANNAKRAYRNIKGFYKASKEKVDDKDFNNTPADVLEGYLGAVVKQNSSISIASSGNFGLA